MYFSAAVHAHVELDAIAFAHHHEIPSRGVGRRRHVHAHKLVTQVRGNFAVRGPGDERHRPDPLTRPLHQYRGTESVAAFRKQGIGNLLDAGVDGTHHRDAVHQGVAPLHQFATRKIAGHGAHHQQDEQGEKHPEAGDMDTQQLVGVPCARQDLQGLVQRADNPVQHPGGDDAGHDDQQTREQPFAQSGHYNLSGRRRRWRAAGGCWRGGRSRCSGRRSRFRLGFGGWGGATPAAATEIRDIPAGTLELEARCSHLLGESLCTAGGACGERGVGDFLQHILGMAAGAAFVGVNRHVSVLRESAKPSIIGGPSTYQPLRNGRAEAG